MRYSVAIRTLGTNPNLLKRELESIYKQSILPEKVMIYIAKGYPRPSFQISNEEYVWVKKGMVSQRALRYVEIESPYILLLDDDVELSPTSVEKMMNAIISYQADCVGADVFETYKLPFLQKFYAAVTNWVFPHFDRLKADKVRIMGSFSYNNNPEVSVLPTQCVGGPCSLWRKDEILRLRWQDELWMESLSNFAFGDDLVESYKSFINGGALLMIFDSMVKNLDGQSSSSNYHKDVKKFYVRSLMSFCNWWRIMYETRPNKIESLLCCLFFSVKSLWIFFINVLAGILLLNIKVPYYYLKGIFDGWRYVHSQMYTTIPSYKL